MVRLYTLKFQRFSVGKVIYLLFLVCFLCPELWASQDAIVVVDQAVIYSDREMTSPLGYVRKGKKLTIGEIPRNKAQVYPIVVSGKVGYIRVLDVTTERETMDSPRLVAERFQENTLRKYKTKYVLSYFNYSSQISLDKDNGGIVNKNVLNWNGVSLKGEVLFGKRWDLQIIGNYMQTTKERESFRAFELGAGAAYRLMNFRSFLLRLEAQALAIPFSNYELSGKFRVNGYGASAGAGVNGTLLFDEHWGLEAYAGVYYTKMFGFETPNAYENASPAFYGNRIGLGVNYSY